MRVIAGESNGTLGAVHRSPSLFPTQTLYLDIQFEKQTTAIESNRMAILRNEGTGVLIQGSAGAKVLLISGQALNEPIAQYGPFVMNTREELMQAVDDFRAGLFNS